MSVGCWALQGDCAGARFSYGRRVLIAFHKPYGVLSQFTATDSPHRTLREFGLPRGPYPVGRLDAESEGLMLLSDEGPLVDLILNPRSNHPRCYWAQVEGLPSEAALERLAGGIDLGDFVTRPAKVWRLDPAPAVPPRDPPIRVRLTVPDSWIAIELTEGKNHQVRKMTASVGHPTLRLIRVRVGGFELGTLAPGEWRELSIEQRRQVLGDLKFPPKRPVARRRPARQNPHR